VDDVLDYAGDVRALGKTLLTDLLEGKPTLPLIRAIAAKPSLAADVEAVRAGDRRAVLHVAAAVRSSGACSSVRALAREESERAEVALQAVPESAARGFLQRIARGLAERAA
jgi:octaprenyl-diphosphate synthase